MYLSIFMRNFKLKKKNCSNVVWCLVPFNPCMLCVSVCGDIEILRVHAIFKYEREEEERKK